MRCLRRRRLVRRLHLLRVRDLRQLRRQKRQLRLQMRARIRVQTLHIHVHRVLAPGRRCIVRMPMPIHRLPTLLLVLVVMVLLLLPLDPQISRLLQVMRQLTTEVWLLGRPLF